MPGFKRSQRCWQQNRLHKKRFLWLWPSVCCQTEWKLLLVRVLVPARRGLTCAAAGRGHGQDLVILYHCTSGLGEGQERDSLPSRSSSSSRWAVCMWLTFFLLFILLLLLFVSSLWFPVNCCHFNPSFWWWFLPFMPLILFSRRRWGGEGDPVSGSVVCKVSVEALNWGDHS